MVDIACIWQEGEGRDSRGMPCRGFCGQIMFQASGSKTPAIAPGAVSIYVFDNVGTIEEQSKPFQVFNFTAEEWDTFQRKTNLGMTYQLFIPYTRPGRLEAECSLRLKFTPKEGGPPIFSQQENIGLRGTSSAANAASAIDRKLTAGSPLFSQSGLSSPTMSNAAVADLARKLQQDSQVRSSGGSSLPTKGAQIERLQSILNESSAKSVQQANYSEQAGSRRRWCNPTMKRQRRNSVSRGARGSC